MFEAWPIRKRVPRILPNYWYRPSEPANAVHISDIPHDDDDDDDENNGLL